jgi:N-acetylglucosamine-6-phosphate deacetylase
LKLKQKDNIAVGLDADVLLLDKDLKIHSVFALGVQVVENGVLLKKGTYEK